MIDTRESIISDGVLLEKSGIVKGRLSLRMDLRIKDEAVRWGLTGGSWQLLNEQKIDENHN